ncbi:MAG: hypothetical protein ABWY95_02245, partial [Thermoleophilaceae bacterium]
MPRFLYLLGAALLGVLLAVPAASAAVLTPTPNPLPGSSFQGADGNQDDAAASIDWQTLQAQGRVQHSPDPNAEDSAFDGGSKEDEPGEWDFTTEAGGVDPGKSNIRDAWSSVDQPGSRTFLYLGFTREEANGTTFLTFELNRDGRLWDNGKARVPCRTTGDILVSYEAKGNDVEVVLKRWVTQAPDPATSCARTGRLEPLASFTPNVDAQGAVNAAAIASRLPGAYEGTVPEERFGEAALDLERLLSDVDDGCFAFTSVWMHSRSSTSESSNMQDYVAPQKADVRNCAASGTKFFDLNANGARDPGDLGIPRFLIWADYDDDGVRDDGEPFSISDNRGTYLIDDIKPPDGTYTLRERVAGRRSRTAPVGLDWTCSFPNDDTPGGTGSAPGGRFPCGWNPINVEETPYVRGRDFGNWFPARLTLEKQLEPTSDPGRFDLLVNGDLWLAGAGDGASVTRPVPPGLYDVSEVAVPGTDPAAYESRVDCRRLNPLRGERASGVGHQGLALTAGMRAVCTFRNIRPGSPAIAIRKVGPQIATAGDVLRYRFYVENIGDVPFAEDAVEVMDPACDEPPELVSKEDASGEDGSPGTLDPGDTWIYSCSNRTSSPGDNCEPTRVDNTGTVTGTTGGTTVDDEDSISTIVFCPDRPTPPPPVPIGPPEPGRPTEPGAVAPAGLAPPRAGVAGRASLLFQRKIRGCITRIPRVNFTGTRIRRVRVYVNGRLQRRVTLRLLERQVRP